MAATFLPDTSGSTKRPDVLTVLGILTFINTGLFTLIYGIGLLGMLQVQQMPYADFLAIFQEGAMKFMPEEDVELLELVIPVLHASGAALMGIYLLRTVLRLLGAIGIWRGRKTGFYLYSAAQLLGIFAPHLILPWELLGVAGPVLTVAVTALYGSQLKRLA